MPNPNENNNPVQNKEKANKEFAEERETPKRENINLESNYKTQGIKPVSINTEVANESLAIGNNSTKSTSGMGGDSSGGLSENPQSSNSKESKETSLSAGSMAAPKEYVPKMTQGKMPKVESNSSSGSMGTVEKTETASKDKSTTKETAPKDKTKTSETPKKEVEKKEKKEIVVSGELKSILNDVSVASKKDDKKLAVEGDENEGVEELKAAKGAIVPQNTTDGNPENENTTSSGGGSMGAGGTGSNYKKKNAEEEKKKAAEAKALTAFSVEETDTEKKEDEKLHEFQNEGKNQGLIVGRSMGYGAMIEPVEGGEFSITKFSEKDDPKEEEDAKNRYNQENDIKAKNMEEFGLETRPESGQISEPKKGYYDAYIEGYNEGHREGSTLKKEAIAAERTAQMDKEQGTDEYKVGASLGMLCGILTAKGEKEVETTFSMTKDDVYKTVKLKTTVAELDSAAFDKKQTPGGELSGSAYEKAFLIHYNMGYREGQKQRSQPPPMDEDYKLGYEQGYKLGNQKGKGETGDEDLLAIETAYDAKDQQTLEKDELQQYRGFYAGYNKGYAQVAAAKKNKAKEEREKNNNKPDFISGYSIGNLKGFLTAMIEPSGIDLAVALKSTAKMEEAGIPDYFPIPDELREGIQATLIHGDNVPENDSEKDKMKALLGKPLCKEGLLFGYNRGYSQGQKSRASFKRDKHKMHPDYQQAILVLMLDDDSSYTGPVEGGGFEKGLTIGQILANAQFEFNELTAKKELSEKEKTQLADLTKALANLNGFIGKKSSYYKSGVNEFYNWWMDKLTKDARKKKAKEGYSGAENSEKRKGFNWGVQVGAKVIEGKEKLKELKRKGRDIKARSAALNNAIKKSEGEAKVTSKNKGGEEYYIGYRNGYNHAFRIAKEEKKSNKGNSDTGDLLTDAKKNKSIVDQVYNEAIVEVHLDISYDKFSAAINALKDESEGKMEKAFEDGLARGYNAGYSATVFDVKTGVKRTDVKTDEEQIRGQYKLYKGEKGKEEEQNSENLSLQLLYFFLVGYQFHNKTSTSTKYGLPKGIADAKSFNLGYEVATAESKDAKVADKSGEASSSDAYKAGYEAAKYQARYNTFKKGMIRSAVGHSTKNEDNESTPKGDEPKSRLKEPLKNQEVDPTLTNGFGALAKSERMDMTQDEEEVSDAFYKAGYSDATNLWTKIIYMRKGIKLEGANIPDEVFVKLLADNADEDDIERETLTTDNTIMAGDYYYNQDEIIPKIANHYIWVNFKNTLNFGTSEFEEAKLKYINGYKAKIKFLEDTYKERFMNAWLYDFAYYMALTEVAPDTDIKMPSAPYAQMNGSEIDYESPHYKNGYLAGLNTGNLIKTGVIQPSTEDLAKVSGDGYNRGFEEGKEEGEKLGLAGAEHPLKEIPTRKTILKKIKEEEKKEREKEKDEEKSREMGLHQAMNYDYMEGYLDAYISTYKETRDYEYGLSLGYKRGKEGGDAMFNLEPEENVEISDQNTFYNGFNEGRNRAASGLSKKEEKKKAASSYGKDYTQILKDNTDNELDQIQTTGTKDDGLGTSENDALAVLKDLLFGGTQDFYLDELLLVEMFDTLESKIEDEQYYIQNDLKDIEQSRYLADLDSRNNIKGDFEKLAKLEKELENESLGEGEKASLDMRILVLKAEIEEKRVKTQQIQHDWETAENAAKERIDSIRRVMKDSLAFDTPLESNEDILNYIKVNLESSVGNDEDIYEDLFIFNDLTLSGSFNYKESKSIDASIIGDANLYLDQYIEDVHIENADVLMKKNGFEFKARGLSYMRNDHDMMFMNGSILTPKIEGGAHMGEQYVYNFHAFKVHLGEGIKSQIDAQKSRLKGGPR